MTRFQLNVEKEFEVSDVLDFIRTFNCEELARELFKIPEEKKIENWEWHSAPWNLPDEEVIGKLIEYLEVDLMFEYHDEGSGYFVIYQLAKKNPINRIKKTAKEKVQFI